MEKPRPSTVAWGVLGASIAAYEILCPDNETLSEALDPLLEKPIKHAIIGAIGITAIHLCNGFERVGLGHLDPFDNGLSRIRQAHKRRTREQN